MIQFGTAAMDKYFGDVIVLPTFSKPHHMKKATFLLLAASVSLSVIAQPSKWFVSVISGYPFGGPLKSIKNNMGKSGLNKTVVYTESFGFFGWGSSSGGVIEYPKGNQKAPLLVRVGKRISNN